MRMSNLNQEEYKKDLENFPYQLIDAYHIATGIKIPNLAKKINLVGFGNNDIACQISKKVFLSNSTCEDKEILYFENYSDYQFNDDTYTIIASYDGDDSFAIEFLKKALKENKKIITITSGGKVRSLSQMNNIQTLLLPKNYKTRNAIGYLLIPILRIFENSNLINPIQENIKKITKILKNEFYQSKSQELAENIYGKIPVIYTSYELNFIGKRWKNLININAKIPAFHNSIEKVKYNEIMIFDNKMFPLHSIIISSDKDDNNSKNILKEIKSILKDKNIPITQMGIKGDNFLQQVLSTIYLGDWISYFLAIKNNQNPFDEDLIERLK